MDAQVTIGAIVASLALGWIAHQHGLIAYIRRQMRARQTWHQGSRDVAIDADRRWT